jgi:excisionase family DNA binding protein
MARHSTPPSDTDPVVLNATEVADLLGVNRKTIYEAAQRGDIPHQRLGRRLLFERGLVLAWLGQGGVIAEREEQR